MDGEPETIKKSLLRSSISGVCLTSHPKVGLNPLYKVGLPHPTHFMQDIFWLVSGGPCGLQFCFKEGFDRVPKCGMSVRKTHNLSPRFLINRYQEPPMLNLHRLVMLDNCAMKIKLLSSRSKTDVTAEPSIY